MRLTRSWLRALPPRLDEYTFIDLGSAKGRVLFVAASHGFHRVIGVEYVKELHDQAVLNVSGAHRRTEEPEIVPMLGNAAEFEFPLDPLVIHFANPFRESVMTRVIANLTASYERLPRPIVATYFQARRERPERTTANIELLAAAPPFARHHTLPFLKSVDQLALRQHRVEMYESPEAIAGRGNGT